MKNPLLISLTALAVLGVTTATTLYAQTTTGSSVIARMKAAATAFTLSADLNPGQTGFESAPVSGKKTGNMLTAAEWNRMLELVAQGGGGSGGTSNITWANFDGSGGVTMKGSNGISSIVRESAGNYRVTFVTPRPNADYGIICTSGPSPSYLCFPNDKSTTSFLIKTSNPTNNIDAPFVSLIVTPFDVGGSSGSSSPLFYYCTNAQSLDSTNAPCYGASRSQGLGDGRYRVVSCHIKGSTGHESINSQLLNFGRTGLAAMQDKWNSLYTDSQWQLCIDGSVLVVDTQAGAGSAGTPTSYPPILCSKTGNSGRSTGYAGDITANFAATDCAGGVLPDTANYIGVVQGMRVCGGIEHFYVTGTSVHAWSNNLCKWSSGKDYLFEVVYIRK